MRNFSITEHRHKEVARIQGVSEIKNYVTYSIFYQSEFSYAGKMDISGIVYEDLELIYAEIGILLKNKGGEQ